MMRKSVVLPDPDGPSIATSSPAAMLQETSSRTLWLPNCLPTPSSRIDVDPRYTELSETSPPCCSRRSSTMR